eukprot:m.3037 g.3037  ORF g.3037 m.3037 type:complete len:67 (-) comp3163_c0_seq1:1158-1358(-)
MCVFSFHLQLRPVCVCWRRLPDNPFVRLEEVPWDHVLAMLGEEHARDDSVSTLLLIEVCTPEAESG